MDQTNLHTFPSKKIEALTMLYLQNLNVSDMTPKELADKYDEVYEKIKQHYYKKRGMKQQISW